MSHRFNLKNEIREGQHPISGGFPEGDRSDLVIPSVGLEDIDAAMFRLFDKELPLQIDPTGDPAGLMKVPVIFAGGEKWAQLKKNKPLRDKSNSLILPLITIGRTNLVQNISDDINGRGINQKTGEIVVRRRLDKSDRAHQNLKNKLDIPNIPGVSSSLSSALFPRSSGVGSLAKNRTVQKGGLLLDNKERNIFETIVVPTPQFVTLTYDVIVWTQYTHHMNQIMETLIASYLPQVQGWRLETTKGYWFLALVEDASISQENNVDDLSQNERIIRQKFTIRVQSYIFATSTPGAPIPVKRYVSAPDISFEVGVPLDNEAVTGEMIEDPHLGSDDPTLPVETSGRKFRSDRRLVGADILNPPESDPALQSFPRGKRANLYKKTADGTYVKITGKNSKFGETSYTTTGGIDDLSGISFEE
jgi:hypothetical protein